MDNKDNIKISVAEDFSVTPGARYREEGDFSGQEFREDHLEKYFGDDKYKENKIEINLDGVLGYGTSFLEEVFGGLSRKFGSAEVLSRISFISEEEPYLIDDIKEYINASKSEK
jgi:hypothetical protein